MGCVNIGGCSALNGTMFILQIILVPPVNFPAASQYSLFHWLMHPWVFTSSGFFLVSVLVFLLSNVILINFLLSFFAALSTCSLFCFFLAMLH